MPGREEKDREKINRHKKTESFIVKPKGLKPGRCSWKAEWEPGFVVTERGFFEEGEVGCWIWLWKLGLPHSWGLWKGKGGQGSPGRVSGCRDVGIPGLVGFRGSWHGGVETLQHMGRTRGPRGLGAWRRENHHLDRSADVVPLATRSLPGAIFLADTHSERCPFPEEKWPDVTADAFSFYFWWPWRSQFLELLPNDSPGKWWQNSHWLREGQDRAFNNSMAFVCTAKPRGVPATGPALIRMVQT